MGHYVRKIGDIGDIETEVEAVLVENDITITPFSPAVSIAHNVLIRMTDIDPTINAPIFAHNGRSTGTSFRIKIQERFTKNPGFQH